MARIVLTATPAPRTGLDGVTAGVASSALGHQVVNNGKRQLLLKNTTAGALAVNVLYGSTVDGMAVGPKVITVPAAVAGAPGIMLTGFFGPQYTQPDGNLYIDFPAPNAGLTALVVEPVAA